MEIASLHRGIRKSRPCRIWYRHSSCFCWRLGLWFITAFVLDLLLVLYIEISRHAIEKVVGRVNSILWFHAGVFVGVLLCYAVMILLGRGLLAGQPGLRKGTLPWA